MGALDIAVIVFVCVVFSVVTGRLIYAKVKRKGGCDGCGCCDCCENCGKQSEDKN